MNVQITEPCDSGEDNTPTGITSQNVPSANDTSAETRQNELLSNIEKEAGFSRVNLIKIENRWRKIMCDEKLESLKGEVILLRDRCELELERNDRIILALRESFERAEDHHCDAMAVYFKNLDSMVNLFNDRLVKVRGEFDARLESLRNEYRTEREEIVQKSKLDCDGIAEEINMFEKIEKRRVSDELRDRQQRLEEVRNGNLDDINSIRFAMGSRIEDLEEQFEQCHVDHCQKTDVIAEELRNLTSRDTEMSGELDDLRQKMNGTQKSMKRLHNSSNQRALLFDEKKSQLSDRKNAAIDKYRDTKGKMQHFCSFRDQKMVDLAKVANGFKSDLKKDCELADRIIKLARMIERFEDERMLCSIDNIENIPLPSHEGYDGRDSKNTATEDYDIQQLGSFWKKYNHVLLDISCVKKEEEKLKKANSILKDNLKKYQEGISISSNVMDTVNPLMIINGKTNIPKRISNQQDEDVSKKRAIRRMTVVDANHAFATLHAR